MPEGFDVVGSLLWSHLAKRRVRYELHDMPYVRVPPGALGTSRCVAPCHHIMQPLADPASGTMVDGELEQTIRDCARTLGEGKGEGEGEGARGGGSHGSPCGAASMPDAVDALVERRLRRARARVFLFVFDGVHQFVEYEVGDDLHAVVGRCFNTTARAIADAPDGSLQANLRDALVQGEVNGTEGVMARLRVPSGLLPLLEHYDRRHDGVPYETYLSRVAEVAEDGQLRLRAEREEHEAVDYHVPSTTRSVPHFLPFWKPGVGPEDSASRALVTAEAMALLLHPNDPAVSDGARCDLLEALGAVWRDMTGQSLGKSRRVGEGGRREENETREGGFEGSGRAREGGGGVEGAMVVVPTAVARCCRFCPSWTAQASRFPASSLGTVQVTTVWTHRLGLCGRERVQTPPASTPTTVVSKTRRTGMGWPGGCALAPTRTFCCDSSGAAIRGGGRAKRTRGAEE